MKKLLTTVLCLMSGYLLAQNPQILNKAQFQQRIQSINLNNSIKFAKAEFAKQGFKNQTEEDDSFQMTIEYTTKDGKTGEMDIDIQSMTKDGGDIAMIANFKRGNSMVVETMNWKANQPLNSFQLNRVIPNGNQFKLNDIKGKGGPSVDFNAEDNESMAFELEPVVSTNSVLAAFFSCLAREVADDCSSVCYSSIMSCINSKKGKFKNKIKDILGSNISIGEIAFNAWDLAKASTKFVGGVATCLANGNCGSCAGSQVVQCFGAAF
jgi:hypothetical protein